VRSRYVWGLLAARPATKEHRMLRDELLATARTQPVDATSMRLFELLTVADVAALLKVSKSWVYEHTRARGTPRSERLPHIKIGKYVRFEPQLVRAFLERRTVDR
jgi:excisionase family DNA binding protein